MIPINYELYEELMANRDGYAMEKVMEYARENKKPRRCANER